MKNNLPTEAGHSKPKLSQEQKVALIDALNQVFTLFRLNYHNQYLKAFSNNEELNEVKRLWLELLGKFEPSTLLAAAKSIIESSEYLPTFRTMLDQCERHDHRFNLPDAHSAYIEACRAPSPKAAFKWSHPAVYYAGKRCDWYFLQSSAETVAYPIFKQKYLELCQEVRDGAILDAPQAPSLENKPEKKASKSDNLERLKSLRADLDL